MTTTAFASLPLAPAFLDNLQSMDYLAMTAIQAQSIPAILEGKDVRAQAKTGSGKTAAFGIGILHALDSAAYHTQALIICPTRELADQISKEIRRLARPIPNIKVLTLCGGTPMGPQLASLEHSPHVVVGTPGRLFKHLEKGTLTLDKLKTLVLDEADRMLDMGFHDDIMRIIALTPPKRQTLLFSATYPKEIEKISNAVQTLPVNICVESLHTDKIIKQVFYEIQSSERTEILVALLQHYHPESCVIFCNRKQQCQELADELSQRGFEVLALHGNLEQKERDQVLVQFANKSVAILIATDVAARGLDIKDLDAVINFEISPDPEVHIHRIGRTGRAGNEGLAISMFMPSEAPKVTAIEKYQNAPVSLEPTSSLTKQDNVKIIPAMVTLCISGGRKDKVRPGDILGALTANEALPGKQIGKIDLFDTLAYVAVERSIANKALKILSEGKIKGRKFNVRKI